MASSQTDCSGGFWGKAGHERKRTMAGIVAALAAVIGLIVLARFLRRRDREGHWDKEGFGTPEHQEPGVKFRPLEAPPSEPFD